MFNGVCCDNPLCSDPPEIGWKTGRTYDKYVYIQLWNQLRYPQYSIVQAHIICVPDLNEHVPYTVRL